jgi:hypothetical protein
MDADVGKVHVGSRAKVDLMQKMRTESGIEKTRK